MAIRIPLLSRLLRRRAARRRHEQAIELAQHHQREEDGWRRAMWGDSADISYYDPDRKD